MVQQFERVSLKDAKGDELERRHGSYGPLVGAFMTLPSGEALCIDAKGAQTVRESRAYAILQAVAQREGIGLRSRIDKEQDKLYLWRDKQRKFEGRRS